MKKMNGELNDPFTFFIVSYLLVLLGSSILFNSCNFSNISTFKFKMAVSTSFRLVGSTRSIASVSFLMALL